MKKLKNNFIFTTVVTLLLILLASQNVFAINIENLFEKVEYSEEYKRWIELPEEERKNVMQPRMYDVLNTNVTQKNPLYATNLLGVSMRERYSLKDTIPDNLKIKNQQRTNTCWAFATISSLETNLALSDYKKGVSTPKVYDYSERHMEYATSKTFLNGAINSLGFNREVGSGANWYIAEPYLTNGSGAILEADMPFENNEDKIDISQIQNKTVASQIYDTVNFPNYNKLVPEEKNEVINRIKQHIQDYGAVFASIHSDTSSNSTCYNNDTGAIYCNTVLHNYNHAVSIVGWDDNYNVDNFSESTRPTNNGAWIIRNSYGERDEYQLDELKNSLFEANRDFCISNGWTEPSLIPNEKIEQLGLTIEGNIAYRRVGDNGFMYVSYEDNNIASMLNGIIKATDKVNYDNIYQYDMYTSTNLLGPETSHIMLYNIFNKKTSGTEYLTDVALYASETYNCKVYVNPNGTSKNLEDLQQVTLKTGESQIINAGYHTLELATPIQINSDNFVVAIEIQGTRNNQVTFYLESPMQGTDLLDCITVENNKCFFAIAEDNFSSWVDLGQLSQIPNANLDDGDSTIKAFTVNHIEETTPTPTATAPENTPTPTEPVNTPTPTATENVPTPTVPENTSTPTATENTPTPTATENVPTPTEPENTPTPTATENIPTPTTPESTSTPTVPINTPTPTPTSEGPSTSTGPENTPTPTPTSENSSSTGPTNTPTPTPTSTPTMNDSSSTTTIISNFDNATGDVKKVKFYTFTNNANNEYTLIDMEIDNIIRNYNGASQYYYYLSTNQNEQNISGWVSINEMQSSTNKLQFTIDSRKLTNYNELTGNSVLYLYVKEVSTQNGQQTVTISKAIKIESNDPAEVYVDNERKDNVRK